jgi:hypothetical protein
MPGWIPSQPVRNDTSKPDCSDIGMNEVCQFFWVKSRLAVHSDAVHSCIETAFIFQEILRAESDSSVSFQFDRGPMALPYPYGLRLEAFANC